ncbi:ubiquitin-conjugating enzyme E2 D3-like [Mytilus edulis]|uniref:ubiquitin-conjugating enzyme E2 D3-like n=1 Tax=Mytilus edulis TaxID=6550 RepID=UPI0039EE5964
MATKRLNKELKELAGNPSPGCSAGPINDDMFNWEGRIQGPDGTPYAGGLFYLRLTIPSDYPLKPPKVKFTTKIYHPNISGSSGEISLGVLKEKWAPSLDIRKVLLNIILLLSCPDPDDPLDTDAAKTL